MFNKETKRTPKTEKNPGDQPKGIQGKKQNQNQNQNQIQNQNQNQNQKQPQNRGRGKGRGASSNQYSGRGSGRGSGSWYNKGKGRPSQAEWERGYYEWDDEQSGASNSQKREYMEDDCYWSELTGPFIRTQDGREYPIYYSTNYNDRRRYRDDRKRERSSSQRRQDRRRNHNSIDESDSEMSERAPKDRKGKGKNVKPTNDKEDRRDASYGD